MSETTVAARPLLLLDETILSIVRERSRRRGYTDLKHDLDLPPLVAVRMGATPTPSACKSALSRLLRASLIIDERRPGGVRRLRPIDGERCHVCGSSLR